MLQNQVFNLLQNLSLKTDQGKQKEEKVSCKTSKMFTNISREISGLECFKPPYPRLSHLSKKLCPTGPYEISVLEKQQIVNKNQPTLALEKERKKKNLLYNGFTFRSYITQDFSRAITTATLFKSFQVKIEDNVTTLFCRQHTQL